MHAGTWLAHPARSAYPSRQWRVCLTEHTINNRVVYTRIHGGYIVGCDNLPRQRHLNQVHLVIPIAIGYLSML